MLQNLQWDSLQQHWARSRVLMLYRIWNGLVAITASTYLLPATVCTRGFETKYRQIQCNACAMCIQPNLLFKCSPTLEHFARWHLPAVTRQLQDSTEHHPADVNTSHFTALFLSVHAWLLSALLFLHTASTAHTWTDATVRHYSALSWYSTWTKTKIPSSGWSGIITSRCLAVTDGGGKCSRLS